MSHCWREISIQVAFTKQERDRQFHEISSWAAQNEIDCVQDIRQFFTGFEEARQAGQGVFFAWELANRDRVVG